MFQTIVNPKDGQLISIYSSKGKHLIKKYIEQSGGDLFRCEAWKNLNNPNFSKSLYDYEKKVKGLNDVMPRDYPNPTDSNYYHQQKSCGKYDGKGTVPKRNTLFHPDFKCKDSDSKEMVREKLERFTNCANERTLHKKNLKTKDRRFVPDPGHDNAIIEAIRKRDTCKLFLKKYQTEHDLEWSSHTQWLENINDENKNSYNITAGVKSTKGKTAPDIKHNITKEEKALYYFPCTPSYNNPDKQCLVLRIPRPQVINKHLIPTRLREKDIPRPSALELYKRILSAFSTDLGEDNLPRNSIPNYIETEKDGGDSWNPKSEDDVLTYRNYQDYYKAFGFSNPMYLKYNKGGSSKKMILIYIKPEYAIQIIPNKDGETWWNDRLTLGENIKRNYARTRATWLHSEYIFNNYVRY